MKKRKIIGRQRLARLATFLHRVPREKFDMERWATFDFSPVTGCGTAACACGWAAHIFKDEGFRLEHVFGGSSLRPTYNGAWNWTAIETFFQISYKTSQDLFGAWDEHDNRVERGPRQVAKRIKHFLQTGKVPKEI